MPLIRGHRIITSQQLGLAMSALGQKCLATLLRGCIRLKPVPKSSRNTTGAFLTKYNETFYACHQFHTSPIHQKVVPFKLSDIGEGIREVIVKEWYVQVGDKVSQFDDVCEVQSDKASVTITSRYDGVVSKLCHKIDDVALVGETLMELDTEETDADAEISTPQLETPKIEIPLNETTVPLSSPESVVLAIPSVRRLAKENSVNLKNVVSTGKGGRVLKEDILAYINKQEIPNVVPTTVVVAPTGATRIEPIRGFTKAMVKTMTKSLEIPHFVYSDEVVVTSLVKLRNEVKDDALKNGFRITFMPFFIKAASNALTVYPILNCILDEKCENIIYKSSHNIGVAIATSRGLIVANIKDVQNKSILDITKDLMRLQDLAAKGTLSNDDLTGGTFTLSNIGVIGGTYTKPVILPPEVAIGAIGKTQVLPRFDKDGNIIPEHIVNVSWSADHRIVDGITMASFSNLWKKYLDNPAHLMLNIPL